MELFLLTIHLMLAVALVASVLVQRNEGGLGGLGGGGGAGAGGMAGFLSGRSQATILTRTTAVIVALFFATSLALAYLGTNHTQKRLIVPESSAPASPTAPVAPTSSSPAPTKPSIPAAPTGQ
ncbi:MAG TPA: preprotein translocase subunit SecG [Dongiaceae bacterium]|nr:preprotein translocase subunit SecG [Dongiaceae bacterium]